MLRDTTFLLVFPVTVAVSRETVVLGRALAVAATREVLVVVGVEVAVLVTAFVVAVRETTARELVVVVPEAGLATVLFDVSRVVTGRDDARGEALVRADCVVATDACIGAIGSASTERIDKSVEQTKKAPASKKTVPIAFLQQSVKLRLFINTLLYSGNDRKPVVL